MNSLVNYIFLGGALSLKLPSTFFKIRYIYQLNDIRILIHGTKNAYTYLREYDVALFEMDNLVTENSESAATRRLGVLLGGYYLYPLCRYDGESLHIDPEIPALSAEDLNRKGKLLRVISSFRKGTDTFFVEEYLDDSIFIPFRQKNDGGGKVDTAKKQIEALYNEIIFKQEQIRKILQENDSFAASSSIIKSVNTTMAPAAVGSYSQAIKANGFLFISGCIGVVPSTNSLISNTDVEMQTRQSLNNLFAILDEAGCARNQICKVTLILVDMAHFKQVNKI